MVSFRRVLEPNWKACNVFIPERWYLIISSGAFIRIVLLLTCFYWICVNETSIHNNCNNELKISLYIVRPGRFYCLHTFKKWFFETVYKIKNIQGFTFRNTSVHFVFRSLDWSKSLKISVTLMVIHTKHLKLPLVCQLNHFSAPEVQLCYCSFTSIIQFYNHFCPFLSFPLAGQKVSATTERVAFKCPEGYGNGNFADPVTCRRFYQVNYTSIRFRFCLRIKDYLNVFVPIFVFIKTTHKFSYGFTSVYVFQERLKNSSLRQT